LYPDIRSFSAELVQESVLRKSGLAARFQTFFFTTVAPKEKQTNKLWDCWTQAEEFLDSPPHHHQE
jgi:hypothetical protein